jgi:hypothetical protein
MSMRIMLFHNLSQRLKQYREPTQMLDKVNNSLDLEKGKKLQKLLKIQR